MEDSMIAAGTMQITDLWGLKKDYQRAKRILRTQFSN